MESPAAYIPADRRLAILGTLDLPERSAGAALFADISGFTPLTEALVRALGPQRGAEALPRQLNLIYDAIIAEVDRYSGSVIGFSGDAITCWFDGDDGLRATASALAIQQAMAQFAAVTIPGAGTVQLAIKVAVAAGSVRRFLVGNPDIQMVDVLAGKVLDRLASAEHLANKGDVILDPQAALHLGDRIIVREQRLDHDTNEHFIVIEGLRTPAAACPWPTFDPNVLNAEHTRPWLLPPVHERLESGLGEFLTELRPAVALFLRFGGIDYDHDPDACTKLDTYVRWVQGILVHYGGFLIQLTIGDKGSYLYAAFGAPIAHGDDAIRAITAAHELRSVPPELHFVHDIQIGVSRGRMRTGAYGGVTRRTYGVLGDETNMSARLMQNAPVGQVYVSLAAQRVTGEAFLWEALPPLRVKGKSEPVTVFRLIGRPEHRAVRLQEPRYSIPIVGRVAEQELIRDRIDQALHGQGQIIGITAEAGMGKSRLVAEAIRLATERELTIFAGECQSYGTNTSYLVWESIWHNFFGIETDAPLDLQIHTLEQRLAEVDPLLVPRLPLLSAVLSLPIPDNDLTASLDAKLRKASLEALLVDCVRAAARTMPLLFVLEDCHWLDPLSHDLLEAIGRAIPDLPVAIVIAYRPPEVNRLQAQRVTDLPHATIIPLADFTPEEASRLINLKLEQLGAGEGTLPAAFVDRITARAQGNPFYIEELLNYIRDRGISPEDTGALTQLDLPTSLHSLILSRIDQLSEHQKLTIRVASVVGRLFQFHWLWGVHPQLGDETRVKSDLEGLSQLDLTPLDQPEPELTYLFKHIVTREVAYESLPFATREVFHGHLGDFIEQTHADSLGQQIDLLAYHYDLSANLAKKREYLRKAGEAAQAAYANEASIDYYRRLLPLLHEEEQAPVMLRLGQVFELVGKWDEAAELYAQALKLYEQASDEEGGALAELATGGLLRKRGEYVAAAEWLNRARMSFEGSANKAGISQVLAEIGEVYRLQGDYPIAQHWYEESLVVAETVSTDEPRKVARAAAFKGAGTLAAQRGDYETARALYEESLEIRRELEDKPNVATILNNLGIVARFQGDFAGASVLNQESLAVFRELGDRWAVGQLLNNQGVLASDLHDYVSARHHLEESLKIRRQIGDKSGLALSLNTLADVVLDEGDAEAAAPLLAEALAISWELSERWVIPYLLEDFAGLAAARGKSERALMLAGAAAELRRVIGVPLPPAEQPRLARLLAPAMQAMEQALGATAWEEGRAMPLEQAIAFALEDDWILDEKMLGQGSPKRTLSP